MKCSMKYRGNRETVVLEYDTLGTTEMALVAKISI